MPRTVLIVEDNPSVREALARLLRIEGHRTLAAATLAEADEKLPAASCVLLDIDLPDGPGTKLLAKVRAENLPIKVAVVSAVGDVVHIRDEIDKLGPDAVFSKPTDVDALLAWIASA